MASINDDFDLLDDDNNNQNQNPHQHHHHHHHHHQNTFNLNPNPNRFAIKPSTVPSFVTGDVSPKEIGLGVSLGVSTTGHVEHGNNDYNDDSGVGAGFCSPPFAAEDEANPFTGESDSDPDLNKSGTDSRHGKRKDRDELSDGGTPYYKRSNSNFGVYRADTRKEREEWSDRAIGSLLDAYTEKFLQLNRANLRGRDWEEVAIIVSKNCDKQKSGKSVEQCKNKVDNLKKRFKLEQHRLKMSNSTNCPWIWYKHMEQIVSNTATTSSGQGAGNVGSPKTVSDEDKSVGLSANMMRQAKRNPIAKSMTIGLVNNLKSKSSPNPRWRRVVFKISGAALAGNGSQNIDPKVALLIAREVAIACRVGVEVAIVVGGRNFFCGDSWISATGLDRSTAYEVGMMATVMNSVLIQSALEKLGVQTRLQTAFQMHGFAEPYSKRRAIRHLEKGRVVIFGGIGAGTGNPIFTTDAAAALRASELNAEAVLKGTNVDGVYDCDSRNSNSNVAFEHISFRELASRGITSMDMMALTFCEDNGVPGWFFLLFNSFYFGYMTFPLQLFFHILEIQVVLMVKLGVLLEKLNESKDQTWGAKV
ncbi:hypothetical protein GIB67_007504 [Kingdonia uniflora]|uniref:UMP kinase n=1 Tax=Kingdonia uniflora TaxID=39325 RepID=A0A7J7LW84_9MAGN|nr:hypothetical protein GIB67_007504 [Kingdonia uniflora]